MNTLNPRTPISRLPAPGEEDNFSLKRPHVLSGAVGLGRDNQRNDVAKIETLLALAGAHDVNQTDGPTGYVGPRLLQSIKSFQKARGLNVDGHLNPDGETIKSLAQNLRGLGRNGDTVLAHISPAEAKLLHDVTDGGTINPVTGLPEFFFGDFFSSFGDSFSSMGDSFASGLSSFGDSFGSGLSSLTDGIGDTFSSMGDSIGDGFNDMFGLKDDLPDLGGKLDKATGSLGKNLTSGLDSDMGIKDMGVKDLGFKDMGLKDISPKAPVKMPNLLEDTFKPASKPLNAMADRTGALVASGPKPKLHPQSFNRLYNKPGIFSPSPAMRDRHKVSLPLEHQRQVSRLKQQQAAQPINRMQDRTGTTSPKLKSRQAQPHANEFQDIKPAQAKPLNRMQDRSAPPALSDEASASNGRLAKTLAKTNDFTSIKKHITPGLEKGDHKAIAETQDLIDQTNKALPGHGDKLAKELGLNPESASSRKKSKLQDTLTGNTGDDTLGNQVGEKSGRKLTHNDIQRLTKQSSENPESLTAQQKKILQAYHMKKQSGGLNANPASGVADVKGSWEHNRTVDSEALRAANAAIGNPEDVSVEEGLKKVLQDSGFPEEASEVAALAISVTPPGIVLNVGEGLFKASHALSRGDTKAALGHLGTAGMDVAKVNKIGAFLKKGGDKAAQALAKALPETLATNMAKDLAKKGLSGPVLQESFSRAFNNGFNTKEALAFGVFSATGKDTLGRATSSAFDKAKVALKSATTEAQRGQIRQIVGKELVQSGAAYLKGVSKEVQSRMVEEVLNDVFIPSGKAGR